MYRLEIRRPAQKAIHDLPPADREQVIAAIDGLVQEPRPAGVEKVRGTPLYRVRVGDYRLIYAVFNPDRLVVVVRVARRTERTYKGL